jgi:hypothetical protein
MRLGPLGFGQQARAQPQETRCGEFGKQAGKITEVMARRSMRNLCFARRRAQGQCADAIPIEDRLGCCEHGRAQVAMVIGPPHASIYTMVRFLFTSTL